MAARTTQAEVEDAELQAAADGAAGRARAPRRMTAARARSR